MSTQLKECFLYYTSKFCKEILIMLLTVITFLSPLHGLFYLISFAVAFDTVFGIYGAVKLKGIKSLTSTKFFNLAVKSFFYMGSIIFAYLIDIYIFDGSVMDIKLLLSKVLCVVWISIEVKSIDETSQKIGNRPFLSILKGLIAKAKGFKKDLNELKD